MGEWKDDHLVLKTYLVSNHVVSEWKGKVWLCSGRCARDGIWPWRPRDWVLPGRPCRTAAAQGSF